MSSRNQRIPEDTSPPVASRIVLLRTSVYAKERYRPKSSQLAEEAASISLLSISQEDGFSASTADQCALTAASRSSFDLAKTPVRVCTACWKGSEAICGPRNKIFQKAVGCMGQGDTKWPPFISENASVIKTRTVRSVRSRR